MQHLTSVLKLGQNCLAAGKDQIKAFSLNKSDHHNVLCMRV